MSISNFKQKIALFRLADMNGAIGEIILKTAVKSELTSVYECTLENMDSELQKFIDNQEYKNYDRVFIVGGNFTTKTADNIDIIMEEEPVKFIYRDHTWESNKLMKYKWSRVLLYDSKGNFISSSKNLYRELVPVNHPKHLRLTLLIDMANASITGYVPEEDVEGKKVIEEIYSLAGSASKFAQSMTEKILSNDAFFNEADILAKREAERKKIEEEEAEMLAMKEKLKRKRNSWW